MTLLSFSSARGCGFPLGLGPLHASNDPISYDNGTSHQNPPAVRAINIPDVSDMVELPNSHY